jgi:4-hydroxybenzoate polyprenyltransferase
MSATASSVAAPGRLRTYASFVRLEHTLFSLPLILAGIFSVPGPRMAAGRWLLTAIAAVGARTAAMSLNRLIDRRLDARNPRTRVRELPSGRMKVAEGVALLVGSAIAYVAACAALGRWYLEVAPIPLAVFTLYPYLKRFTPLCHAGVGAALALSPLAGYAVAHPDLSRTAPAFALAAFALVWVTGFDIIYATLDEASDRETGIHSMVVWLGRERALRVSAALHLIAGLAVALAWRLVIGSVAAMRTPWGVASMVCLVAVAFLLGLEQRLAENVDLAFFKINVWVGAAVLATVLAARMAAGGF